MSKKQKVSSQNKSPYNDVLTFVKSKQFGLANIGISHKTSFDWRAHGIYLQEKTTKARMKYSAVEYIWLLLVKELRDFGLPLKAIKNLKDSLLITVSPKDVLLAFKKELDLLNEDSELLALLESENIPFNFKSESELQVQVEELGENVVSSMFTSMIMSILLDKEGYTLFIKKDGNCLIESDSAIRQILNFSSEKFKDDTCLRIQLKNFVIDFLKKENIKEFDFLLKENRKDVTEDLEFKSNKSFIEPSTELQHYIDQFVSQMKSDEVTYRTNDGKKISIKKSMDEKQ